MANSLRMTREQFEAHAKRRLARHAEAEFAKEMAAQNLATQWLESDPKRPIVAKQTVPSHISGRLCPLVLLCQAHGLPEPRPEYNFSPTRGWRFDYAFVDRKIACEVEGGIWRRGGGAHSHPMGIERDIEKYNAAAVLGWRILRAAPEKLGSLIPLLQEMLRRHQNSIANTHLILALMIGRQRGRGLIGAMDCVIRHPIGNKNRKTGMVCLRSFAAT